MGQGLNAKGIKLLSQKLANLTIGDLEALLDLKNMDSSQVSLLLSQLKDLAKALVNRTCHLRDFLPILFVSLCHQLSV